MMKNYREAISHYSKSDILRSARKARTFLEISKELKINHAVVGPLTSSLGIREEVRWMFEKNRIKNPRLKHYSEKQMLELSEECSSLKEMGEELGITRERVRQISNLFKIHRQILKNLKLNRSL